MSASSSNPHLLPVCPKKPQKGDNETDDEPTGQSTLNKLIYESFTTIKHVFRRQKRKGIFFLIVVVSLITLEVILLFFLGLASYDEFASFQWTDTCHGAEVDIFLTTDSPWVTRHTDPPWVTRDLGYKIAFGFSVRNINGSSNATFNSNNSYVILNRVKLDPFYFNLSESPFKQLSDRQGWSIDRYVIPNATDTPLRSLGIAKGKQINYPLLLNVNYTVVDSIGIEWAGIFQKYANITIVGGSDAPQREEEISF